MAVWQRQATSSGSRPASCRQIQRRRRVAWSSDLEPPHLTDETVISDDISPDDSYSRQLQLRAKSGGQFETGDNDHGMDHVSNPATQSADRLERQEDEMVLETSTTDRRVMFFTGYDERLTPTSSQPDVEMRVDSPCFSDRGGFDGRN